MGVPLGDSEFVRHIGGSTLSCAITGLPHARVEMISKKTDDTATWHFKQPELALFWYQSGSKRLRATVEGKPLRAEFDGERKFAIIPAGIEIEGEFDVQPVCDYTVIFFDPYMVMNKLPVDLSSLIVGFKHRGLSQGMANLRREAAINDSLFPLFAEGWACQALAYMAQVTGLADTGRVRVRGGLPPYRLNMVKEYIDAHFTNAISLDELAKLSQMSSRHFLRGFRESIGVTPYSYILDRRLVYAKELLLKSKETITSIALLSGFGNSQHFATMFRKATGLSPREFRLNA